jgi:hypothetical protein
MKKIASLGIIIALAYFGSGRMWIGNRICIAHELGRVIN